MPRLHRCPGASPWRWISGCRNDAHETGFRRSRRRSDRLAAMVARHGRRIRSRSRSGARVPRGQGTAASLGGRDPHSRPRRSAVCTGDQLLVNFLSRIRSKRSGQVFLESRGEGVRKIFEDGRSPLRPPPRHSCWTLPPTWWSRPRSRAPTRARSNATDRWECGSCGDCTAARDRGKRLPRTTSTTRTRWSVTSGGSRATWECAM